MVPKLLLRGLIVGALAGVLAFGFARVFGEPLVAQAIAFEESHPHEASDAGHQHEHAQHDHAQEEGPELVPRSVQAGAGLLIATVVYGAALGGLFALVFSYWNRRVALRPRAVAALIAGLGFIAVGLVPYLIYPANPPAVGSPDTIGARTALFFGALLISTAALALAIALGRRLATRRDTWNAALAGGLTYVIVMFIAEALLPRIHEVPVGFSAELLWQFRMASLGMHCVIWSTLGIGYGIAVERLLMRPAQGRMSGATRN